MVDTSAGQRLVSEIVISWKADAFQDGWLDSAVTMLEKAGDGVVWKVTPGQGSVGSQLDVECDERKLRLGGNGCTGVIRTGAGDYKVALILFALAVKHSFAVKMTDNAAEIISGRRQLKGVFALVGRRFNMIEPGHDEFDAFATRVELLRKVNPEFTQKYPQVARLF